MSENIEDNASIMGRIFCHTIKSLLYQIVHHRKSTLIEHSITVIEPSDCSIRVGWSLWKAYYEASLV